MGIKFLKGEERFVVETEKERRILEMARNYFGEASTLLNDGLGFSFSKKCSNNYFYRIKNRKEYPNGSKGSITVEKWKKVQEYALKYIRGERHEIKTTFTIHM